MTVHLVTSREADAVRINAAAEVVRSLTILGDRKYTIEVTIDTDDTEVEINVHHCTPDELELVLEGFTSAKAHRDADEIVRWVEVKSGLVTLTFFRR